jgi:hypothetical protein
MGESYLKNNSGIYRNFMEKLGDINIKLDSWDNSEDKLEEIDWEFRKLVERGW